jgi:GntR family transcriptional regulator / MocR family aminotransferase
VLAPGLRIGFLVAASNALERITSIRVAADLQGDHVLECAIAELIEEGDLQRHVRKMRELCRKRRDALMASLEKHLGGIVRFAPPAGGMALWAHVDPNVDVDAWSTRASTMGVTFLGARIYDFERRSIPYARLGFSPLNEAELEEAVARMKRALPRSRDARDDVRKRAT